MDKYIKTPLGERIKHWREQKGISQLDLALECDTSSKHLSFIETGKATPARDLLLALLTFLDVPLEATNNLLISAGYAPSYEGTGLKSNEFKQALACLEQLMLVNTVNPAAIIDKNWQIKATNPAFVELTKQFCQNPLLFNCPTPNLLTLLLHPQGLISCVVDKSTFYRALYSRARRLMAVFDDSVVAKSLMDEIISYAPNKQDFQHVETPQLMVPIVLENEHCKLALAFTSVCLGDPLNVALQEQQIEMFVANDNNSKLKLQSWVKQAS